MYVASRVEAKAAAAQYQAGVECPQADSESRRRF
jgi:hypothetical protein